MENPIERIVSKRLCRFSKSKAKAMSQDFKKTGYKFMDLAEYLVYKHSDKFKNKASASKFISYFSNGCEELNPDRINLIGNGMIEFMKEVKEQEILLNKNK